VYVGYEMAVFPDSIDRQTPKIGYLPGRMAMEASEKLEPTPQHEPRQPQTETSCEQQS
jgi:molecular chaperone Hsp31 and glyoxalase 3